MLSNVINHASNQVEGFCFIKSLQLKVNVKGAEYLDIMLADADGEINAKLWDYQSAVHGMYSAGGVRCRNGSKRKRETDGTCQQHGTGICD